MEDTSFFTETELLRGPRKPTLGEPMRGGRGLRSTCIRNVGVMYARNRKVPVVSKEPTACAAAGRIENCAPTARHYNELVEVAGSRYVDSGHCSVANDESTALSVS